ncbi:mitochondrial carrier protein [Phyllosticta citribraziliensis]|uniref:Mitochondrial carrier protein n=1 Tax=Phyllosticta citribraziliensis TaxID=989973 RepID=A0ABR1LP37_9PEZI
MSGNTHTDILLAGAFAAFTVDLLVYPLDTLKTRWQSPDFSRLFYNAATNTVNRRALFRGAYQGVGSVIIATLPSSGAFFTTYEGVKAFLNTHAHSLPHGSLPDPLIHAAASSVGELVSCAILTPAEVIKQNAQMVNTSAATASSVSPTVQTLRKFRHNPLALWRGYGALAGRNLPHTAIQFPLFERMKQAIWARRERDGTKTGTLLESGLVTAVSAGSAGSVAAVLTTPIDVLKTRIMLAAADGEASSSSSNPKPSNGNGNGLVDALGNKKTQVRPRAGGSKSMAIIREILAQEGMRGLWRGGALRGVWTFIGLGLYLGVYETGRVFLARRRGEDVGIEDVV